MKVAPIFQEVIIKAPAYKVWQAITNKDNMKIWYFEVPEFKTEVGFSFTLYGEKEGRRFPILCRITEVKLCEKLSYTWNYVNFPTETIVSFELIALENETLVKFTHTGLEKMSPEHKDVSRDNHEKAWMAIIGDSLKNFVERY